MNKVFNKNTVLKIITATLIFWLSDTILHQIGVGETNYYYLSKLANGVLFSIIWFTSLNYQKQWQKLLYSVIFGTWVSSYYFITSYSGLVQFFGIYARYSPPAFVIDGIFVTPLLWWVTHSLGLYLGIIMADRIKK